jgi:hypothetical protein
MSVVARKLVGMLDEPRAGRLAAWGNALLAGQASPDDAAERAVGADGVHRVAGLPGEEGLVGLTLAFGRLRALGVTALRVALPVPGHPLGLCGPPEFNAVALDAGEAVLAPEAGLGLVPEVAARAVDGSGTAAGAARAAAGAEVTWHCLEVRRDLPPDVPSLSEAERELAQVLRETTSGLLAMDLPSARPAARAELEAYRARTEAHRSLLAPGYPPRAVRVLELAQRVAELMVIAEAPEHDGSLTSGQLAMRDRLLRPVRHAARRAQVAAYNACAEETERRRAGS